MNLRKTTLIIALLAVFTAGAFAANADLGFLERSIQKVKSYRYGQNGFDLVGIEENVGIASKNSEQRPKVEQMIIDALASAETNDARQFLCRQLRTIGTAKCVPQLESMLTNNEMSHMARYALGKIEDPEAGAALQRALAKTSGVLKVGVISSLVDLKYKPALGDITKLVNDGDKQVAVAAVRALGRFGGSASVETLSKVRQSADDAMKLEIDDSMLLCGEKFVAEGKKNDARKIYKEYYSEKYSEQLRIAGLKGLMNVDGDAVVDMLLEAIKGSDASLRGNAIAMIAELKSDNITDTFIKIFNTLPQDGQELVLRAFEYRGDSSATPAIIGAISSEHENVRRAALIALGGVGTSDGIATLAKAASSGSNEEREIAKASLTRMKGKGMDEAFIRAINTGDDKSRIEIIRAIGMRGTTKAFPFLLKVAKSDSNAQFRREAILSMGMVGPASEIETLLGLVIKPYDAADRGSIETAISRIFNKIDDRNAKARPVIAALEKAPADAKPVLLSLLNKPATAEAIEVVRAAAKSRNEVISNGAIRSMFEWPNTDPVEDIYQIAATSENQVYCVLALRNYVRLARISEEPTPMYAKAMKLAKRGDEIKQVLGGLGFDDTLESYNLACQYIDKDEFKNDAYLAAVKIMSSYCWEDAERGKAELQKIIDNAPNEDVRNRARRAMENMGKSGDYIFSWKVAGPYVIKGNNDGMQVFQTPFEPEKDPDSRNIKWIKMNMVVHDKKIDLQATFGDMDYCSAYARTYVWSPKEQEVKFEGSADDYLKGWINGEKINGNFRLKEGRNTFMLKVGDHAGGWLFNCRIVKPDGSKPEGLKFKRISK